MADEEKNETTEEPQAEEQAAAEQAAPEAQAVDEVPAEEPAADDAPAAEPPAEDAPAEEAPGAEAEAVEAPAEEAAPEPAAVSEKKKKQKRLPRPQRRQRSKPKREPAAERKPITRTPKPESERGRRQERRGVVVSSAMDKTIVVKVDTIKSHQRYKKVVRRSAKFHAHDEQNSANVGDIVRIIETRPLSKTKHWKLVEVVEAAK
jgi:small subunit ribosomal protein S17